MALDLSAILARLLASWTNNFGNLAEAILIILAGWLLGKVLGTLIKRALDAVKIDKYFKIDDSFKLSTILSVVVTWIVYLVFIQAALWELGIPVLSDYFETVTNLIGSMLGALLILIIGYFIAKHGQNYFKKRKHEYSKPVAQGVFLFTMVISLSMALETVGLSTVLVNNIILILVASFGLGLAIAIGLGLRETVSRVAKKYEKKI